MSNDDKTAIILVNIGTPEQPDAKSVAKFLGEFLSDTRVIEGSGPRRWIWLAVLKLIVLRTRPKKVAKLYQEIWQQGSPMRTILQAQVDALQQRLSASYKNAPKVFAAMTYGDQNISELLVQLQRQNYQKIFVMPMFPQYSATSTGAVYDCIANFQRRSREVLDIRIVKSYYRDENFIRALTESIESHWRVNTPAQKTVFSYHGIPQQYADDGDPYPIHCFETTQLVKARLLCGEFSEQADTIISTFQSRFGPTQWLQPYTDVTLTDLAQQVASVDVICPAFSADCLETLEEIAKTNKTVFMDAGGQQYRYIEALNDQPLFIDCLVKIVQQQAIDWLGEKIES